MICLYIGLMFNTLLFIPLYAVVNIIAIFLLNNEDNSKEQWICLTPVFWFLIIWFIIGCLFGMYSKDVIKKFKDLFKDKFKSVFKKIFPYSSNSHIFWFFVHLILLICIWFIPMYEDFNKLLIIVYLIILSLCTLIEGLSEKLNRQYISDKLWIYLSPLYWLYFIYHNINNFIFKPVFRSIDKFNDWLNY